MLKGLSKLNIYALLVLGMAASATAQNEITERTLKSMGYTIVKTSSPALQDWEINDLKMESKQIFVIMSVRKIPGNENMYRRFAVTIEKYKDQADAVERIRNIEATPPGPNSKLTAPEYALREGFGRGLTLVFVVSTEVYTFVADGSLHKFTQDLDKKLPLIK